MTLRPPSFCLPNAMKPLPVPYPSQPTAPAVFWQVAIPCNGGLVRQANDENIKPGKIPGARLVIQCFCIAKSKRLNYPFGTSVCSHRVDGKGRAFDNIFVERLWRNVKYEDVYRNGYATMGELLIGLTKYFTFYNGEHLHQSLANKTPDVVCASGIGGGAGIVDRFPGKAEELPVALPSMETRSTESGDQKTNLKPQQRCPAAVEIAAT